MQLYSQKWKQLLPKLTGKPNITIRDNLLRYTIFANPLFKKYICNIKCTTRSFDRDEHTHSTKTINDTKNSIMTIRWCRQGHNKIHGNMLKRSLRVLNRLQQTRRLLSTMLTTLTYRAIANKQLNSLLHGLKIETWLYTIYSNFLYPKCPPSALECKSLSNT